MQTMSGSKLTARAQPAKARCGACQGPVKSGHRYCSDCATQLDESAGVEIEVTPAVLGPSGPPQRSAFPPRPVFASSKPAAAIAPRPAPVAPKPVAPKPVAPV